MLSRVVALAAVVAACLLTSGCYVLQAAGGQLEVMRRSEPIERVLADPATPDATRKGLELTVAARAFAESELALPAGRSYRRYAALGRPYVVWNLVATPEFSVEPRRWCFPVAGCVAYRGYFRETKARAHAAKLAAQGADVYVGGVAAYSTLGWFSDPLLNTMLVWDDRRLVKTLFHELAHQRVYFPGDTAFNESFAMAVADLGYARWRASRGETPAADEEERRDEALIELLIRHRDALQALYARADLDDAAKLVAKHTQFAALAADYLALKSNWHGDTSYDRWMSEDMNNAKLASIATYHEGVPGFLALFTQCGESFAEFYRRVEAMKGETKEARAEALDVLARGQS